MYINITRLISSVLPLAVLLLAACSGGGGGGTASSAPSTPPAVTYSVGGTLTGLTTGNSIILTNNGSDNLTLSASGVSQTFTFATKLADASTYNLTLSATSPVVQPCTSTYGAGTINAANVTSLNVFCGQIGGVSTFTATGSMLTSRYGHAATLLPNGKVLITGGYNTANGYLTSAELYDPISGTWIQPGSMVTGREYHTATLIPNGKVLVSGGVNLTSILPSTELYDPVAATWSSPGSLTTARNGHTATLLPDGKVLVSGGYNLTTGYLVSAELYDPSTGAWGTAGSLATARAGHTATLLPNGKVLVSGGDNTTSYLVNAELFY